MTVQNKDIMDVTDFSEATLVLMYLSVKANSILKQRLVSHIEVLDHICTTLFLYEAHLSQMRVGSKVVCVWFPILEWTADWSEEIECDALGKDKVALHWYTVTQEMKDRPVDQAHDEQVFQEWKKKQIWKQ